MRRQAQGHRVGLVSLSAVVVTGAAALMVTGCVRSRPEPGLLGPRAVVPAPYVEPAATVPAATLPAEPAIAPAAVLPTGATLDENVIQLPAEPEEKATAIEKPAPRKVESERMTYTVKKGDSLWLIGQMYGVSVPELTAENDISPSKVLRVGQVLKLPAGARLRDVSEIRRATAKRHAAPAPAAKKSSGGSKSASTSARSSSGGTAKRSVAKEPIPADGMYTIKSGDNPWDVARKFGVKHEDLMQWNNLKSDTVLQIGQKLRLRGGAAEAAAPSALPVAPAATAVTPEAVPAPGAVLPETTPLTVPGAPATTTPTTETPATGAPAAVPGTTAPAADATVPAGTTAPAATGAAATGAALAAPATGAAAPTVQPGALDLPKKLQHTVTEGETLQIIAEMYGTTVEAIKKENPTIKGDADLQPNLKLMVPYR